MPLKQLTDSQTVGGRSEIAGVRSGKVVKMAANVNRTGLGVWTRRGETVARRKVLKRRMMMMIAMAFGNLDVSLFTLLATVPPPTIFTEIKYEISRIAKSLCADFVSCDCILLHYGF